MTTWDDRFEDFGRNALDNYCRYHHEAARKSANRETTTEVTLAIQACMAVFVVLQENHAQVERGDAEPVRIDQAALSMALGYVTTTFPISGSGKSPEKKSAIRHAFAHFNVKFAPESGDIEKLLLASFSKDSKNEYAVPKWNGEITVADLHNFVVALANMWPPRRTS